MAAMSTIKFLGQKIAFQNSPSAKMSRILSLHLETKVSSFTKEKGHRRTKTRTKNVWADPAVSAITAKQDFADEFSVFLELVTMTHGRGHVKIGVFSPVIFKDPDLDPHVA
ncbi:uncharacterized protein Bfra_005335 [Botrytis fragariae]|uniref:Uncharacterized protein n=1 Tax=Botrytis fragariae TaxID=1964551 RepID=A0A8H6AUL5_9HELO|nr:uncharacterized protein Bfra_005335 [Botrytis fragariae]KAF5873868.1 hypothetical protein Bfra_005335 [Botrytis fragariae]